MMSSERKHTKDPHADGLCNTCIFMTATIEGLRSLVSKGGYQHLREDEFRESCRRGCPLCRIFRLYLDIKFDEGHIRVYALPASAHLDDNNNKIEHPFGDIRRVQHLTLNPYPIDKDFRSLLRVFTTPDDPATQFLDVLPTLVPVMSNSITDRIKDLLTICQKEHQYCPSADIPILPKRVLDVGINQPNLPVRVHVSGANEKADYVALSYCWGGAQDITTTSKTLESYMKSLPVELPKTIQDAISVTRSLGFRYLWVDSLCILQDDVSDNFAEINEMGEIYKSATLTIAAASASSVKEGFLQDRIPSRMCRLPFYITNEQTGSIWLRNPDKQYAEGPLDKRAWTMQESLLSRRVLYYAPQDLIWKCQTDKFATVRETHAPYFKPDDDRLPNRSFGYQEPPNPNPHYDRTSHYQRKWDFIIYDFTRRKLSVPEDRLNALAGLAREYHKVCADNYIAGMWQRSLVRSLGWEQWLSVSRSSRNPLTTYKSPTWSWLSSDGQVNIPSTFREEAELLDVTVALVDENVPFGSVKSGTVVLRAPVLPGDTGMYLGRVKFDGTGFGGVPALNMIPANAKFLLLGYGLNKYPIALILSPLEDGTFVRIGFCEGTKENSEAAVSWSSESVKRETIKII